LKYKKPIDKNQKPAHTQKTKVKWDTADKDKYVELVNEGIQSSDLKGVMDVLFSPICFPVIKCSLFIFYSLEYFL
jgi:hypothetical protein